MKNKYLYIILILALVTVSFFGFYKVSLADTAYCYTVPDWTVTGTTGGLCQYNPGDGLNECKPAKLLSCYCPDPQIASCSWDGVTTQTQNSCDTAAKPLDYVDCSYQVWECDPCTDPCPAVSISAVQGWNSVDGWHTGDVYTIDTILAIYGTGFSTGGNTVLVDNSPVSVTYNNDPDVNPDQINVTISPLTTGTHGVVVTNSPSCSISSAPFDVIVLVKPTPPPTPTGLSVSPSTCGNNWLNISWNASSGATSYQVYRDGGGTPVYNGAALAFSDTGLALGSTHSYTVRATNSVGSSSQSGSVSNTVAVACAVPPPTVTGFTATPSSCGTGQINLSWNSSSGATSYKIYRNGVLVQTTASLSWSDTGLTASASYTYTIKASNSAGDSTAVGTSPAATVAPAVCAVPPPTPTGFWAGASPTCGSGQINLSWNSSAGAVNYKIYRNGALVQTTANLFWSDTGLTASTGYTYTIKSSNSSGDSAAGPTTPAVTTSPPVCVVPVPVTTFTANPTTMTLPTNSTVLSWSATNSPTGCTASANPANANWSGAKGVSGPQTISGLTAGTYTYSLYCTNSGGNSATVSQMVVVNPVGVPAPNLKITSAAASPFTGITNSDGPVELYNSAPYTLSWAAVSNAVSCTLDGVAVSAAGGSQAGTAIWLTKTHTLTCLNSSGVSGTDTLTFTVPPQPTAVSGSCSANGTTGTVTWTAPGGYSTFYVRAQNVTTGAMVSYIDNFSGTNGANSSPFAMTPGQTFNAWIHTRNASNNAWSSEVYSGNVTCSVTPTDNASCGAVTISPATIYPGNTVTITRTMNNTGNTTWNTTTGGFGGYRLGNAAMRSLFSGTIAPGGSYPFPYTETAQATPGSQTLNPVQMLIEGMWWFGNVCPGPVITVSTPSCANGANNPPTCNTCTAPLVWNTTSLACVSPLSISVSPAAYSVTLPSNTISATYTLTNGTSANTTCRLLDNAGTPLTSYASCNSPMSVTAPAVASTYAYSIQAFKVSTNETKTSNTFTVTVNPAAPVDNASCGAVTISPATIYPGNTVTITRTMNNTGNTTWNTTTGGAGGYKLGSSNIMRTVMSGTVAPGGNYSFPYTETAQATPGSQTLNPVQMLIEGMWWFGNVCPGPVITVTPATTCVAAGNGTGLTGKYYDGTAFNTLVTTRIDSTINFNPADNQGVLYANGGDTFSGRWEGQVQPTCSETYTFYTNSDDGVRLWVNGVQVVNNWTDHGPTENSGTVALIAGTKYDIKMEFYESGGGATAQLSWSSPTTAKAIVPQTQLYPLALSPDLTASAPTQNTATIGTAKTFTSTITNGGTGPTGATFYNSLQVAAGQDGAGPITPLTASTPSPMSALNAGASLTASASYTFTGSAGIRSVRFCADNNASWVGTITESSEGNNCSDPWTNVTVSPIANATANITANGDGTSTNISYGGGVTVAWNYTNATSCTLDPAIANITVFPSGSGTFSTTLTEDENYKISCDPGGSYDEVLVDVAAQPKTINVIKSGQGTVVSSPAGINCGSGCSNQTVEFAPNISVTLTATPATGRIFTGWGGACSGKVLSCTVVTDGDKMIIANFMVDPNWKEF